ncbi:MAG TPA: nitrogen regulation protein NR(II) [Gammaproteobacteria bacterium]|nr:nitrogen regulation protein NR(II) [Gammaproteobacteria bacterium]
MLALSPMPDQTFERILENLNSTIMLFDAELRLRYINPAGERLFEVSARQLLGSPVQSLLLNAVELEEILNEALASGTSFTRREMTLDMLHAEQVTVDATATPAVDAAGRAEVLIELVEIDRILRITRDEKLFSQQDVTSEMLRGLAHEIKNPLGGLRGAAQLLGKQLDQDELREYTDVIIGEADRLQNLVNRMLVPRMMPETDETNIHEVLERVRSVLLAEFGERVHLHRDYDPSIPALIGDREQLIQAVLNIVRNAIEAGGEGAEVVLRTRVLRKFTIGTTRHRLVARIDIMDNGPGVPAAIRDRIFYPMVTGRAEGTGLGLSIAQSLIQRHGGLIECDSAPGHTVFTILLPVLSGVEKQ